MGRRTPCRPPGAPRFHACPCAPAAHDDSQRPALGAAAPVPRSAEGSRALARAPAAQAEGLPDRTDGPARLRPPPAIWGLFLNKEAEFMPQVFVLTRVVAPLLAPGRGSPPPRPRRPGVPRRWPRSSGARLPWPPPLGARRRDYAAEQNCSPSRTAHRPIGLLRGHAALLADAPAERPPFSSPASPCTASRTSPAPGYPEQSAPSGRLRGRVSIPLRPATPHRGGPLRRQVVHHRGDPAVSSGPPHPCRATLSARQISPRSSAIRRVLGYAEGR